MAKKGKKLPTSQEILEYIKASPSKVGKRELARAFNLKGQDRIWLKDLLKEMGKEGLIERGHKRKVHFPKSLPPVVLVEVSSELSDEGEVLLIPIEMPEGTPAILLTDKGASTVNPGEKLLR